MTICDNLIRVLREQLIGECLGTNRKKHHLQTFVSSLTSSFCLTTLDFEFNNSKYTVNLINLIVHGPSFLTRLLDIMQNPGFSVDVASESHIHIHFQFQFAFLSCKSFGFTKHVPYAHISSLPDEKNCLISCDRPE